MCTAIAGVVAGNASVQSGKIDCKHSAIAFVTALYSGKQSW